MLIYSVHVDGFRAQNPKSIIAWSSRTRFPIQSPFFNGTTEQRQWSLRIFCQKSMQNELWLIFCNYVIQNKYPIYFQRRTRKIIIAWKFNCQTVPPHSTKLEKVIGVILYLRKRPMYLGIFLKQNHVSDLVSYHISSEHMNYSKLLLSTWINVAEI